MDSLRQDFASLFSEGVSIDPDTTAFVVRRRRDALFREPLANLIWRYGRNVVDAMRPKTVRQLRGLLTDPENVGFPPPLPSFERVAAAKTDLWGPVSDLSPAGVVDLYARGLYPESVAGIIAWRSPAERQISDLGTSDHHDLSSEAHWTVTFDRDFDAVIAICARPSHGIVHAGRMPTWLSPKILYAFADLFEAGIAHSFEVADRSGSLIAGGYGLTIGRIFITESWFSRCRGGAEAGLAALNQQLANWGYVFNDAKTRRGPGFKPIARSAYMGTLAISLAGGKHGRWRVN